MVNPYLLAALAETRAADLRELASSGGARERRSSWRPRRPYASTRPTAANAITHTLHGLIGTRRP